METVSWLRPEWPAPSNIHARITTRQTPGVSQPPRDHCNLGSRCGDTADEVSRNRASLADLLHLPSAPRWLHQVHGTDVVDADVVPSSEEPVADAAIGRNAVLAVLTADCMPILFCTSDGERIGVAHAGWRGLSAGVVEATVAALDASPSRVMAWLGPSIGARSYEVGTEVRQAFIDRHVDSAALFKPTRPDHWLCDLEALARARLTAIGVSRVSGGGFDTRTDPRFYSYRRDPHCGRFASLIWRDNR